MSCKTIRKCQLTVLAIILAGIFHSFCGKLSFFNDYVYVTGKTIYVKKRTHECEYIPIMLEMNVPASNRPDSTYGTTQPTNNQH